MLGRGGAGATIFKPVTDGSQKGLVLTSVAAPLGKD